MAGSADKTGSAQNKSSSASTFLSTLIPVLLIVTVILSVFLILRPKYKRVYEPRTYLPLLRK
jgi:preprotein translocase subunit YajC